jgi:pimeloyl-ACP methyl ester carboxylesterase
VICAEDVPLYPAAPPAQATYLKFQPDEIIQRCQSWPHSPASAAFSQPLQSNVPTLLLSGSADPITPPTNAAQAAATLPNSRQIVIAGLGHNIFYYGCLPRLLNDFLATTDPQALEPACLESIQPSKFFTSFTGSLP